MTQRRIKKALISDAGMASRYLPVLKASPKGLLPLLNRSIMDWVLLECKEAGIEEIIIVTSVNNVEKYEQYYHDSAQHIKDALQKQNKLERYDGIVELFSLPKITIIAQSVDLPYGTAAPLVTARQFLDKEEGFVFCQGDDVILGKHKDVAKMIELFNSNADLAGVIMTQATPENELHNYGVVKLRNSGLLEEIVERPSKGSAPSRLVSYGRYLLTPEIFKYTEERKSNPNTGEFMLVDAITSLAVNHDVLVGKTDGLWLTTGDPVNHLKAQIAFALNDEKYKHSIQDFIDIELKKLYATSLPVHK